MKTTVKQAILLSLTLAMTACATPSLTGLDGVSNVNASSTLPSALLSDDGKLAYVLESKINKQKVSQLIISSPTGQNARAVFQVAGTIFSPAWSPDGRQLAFSVQYPKGLAVIYLLNIANGQARLITPYKTNNLSPSFSPDGQSILFANSLDGDSDIYRLNLKQAQLEKIIDLPSTEVQPSYAPDGKSFVFVSDNITAGKPQLYRYDFATGQTTRLSNNRYSASPSISPTADKIAFLQGQQAVIMNLTTQTLTDIANTGLDEAPRFSPDGRRVVYASSDGQSHKINIYNLNTGKTTSFYTNGVARSPVWSK